MANPDFRRQHERRQALKRARTAARLQPPPDWQYLDKQSGEWVLVGAHDPIAILSPAALKPKVAEFLSGPGGMTFGQQVVSTVVAGCEHDDAARRTNEENFAVKLHRFSNQLAADSEIVADVVVSGGDCSAFARAGKKEWSTSHASAKSFRDVCRFIKAHRIEFFAFENVPDMLTQCRGRCWTWHVNKLREAGMLVADITTVNSQDWGCAEHRVRMIMLAVREDILDVLGRK